MQDQSSSAKPSQPQGCLCALATAVRAIIDRFCSPSPASMPLTRKRDVISFLPGSITVLVEHDARLSRTDVARATQAELNQRNLSQRIIISERKSPRALVTFASAGRTFSLVSASVPGATNQYSRLIPALVIELNRQLNPTPPRRAGSGDVQQSAQQRSAQAGDRSTEAGAGSAAPSAAHATAEAAPAVRLVVASPQWLSTGSPTAKGGGGPGGRPILAGLGRERGASDPPWRITFPPEQPAQVTGDGSGVIVAVLDTLQTEDVLDEAYDQYVANAPAGTTPHPALAGLWGVPRRLHVYPAGGSHLLQEIDCDLRDHDYVMPDHGVFAAGLIHSIAPRAEIHLIEVLNPYGVGSLASIGAGLAKVLELRRQNPRTPMVVNLSLVLTMPQLDKDMIAYLARTDPPLGAFTPHEIEQTSYLLQQLCYLLLDEGIFVVAAAGNDADDEGIAQALQGRRPEARFPAAYEGIVGVGALDHNESAAIYSNRSDRPTRQGLAVWGGDKSTTSDLTDVDNGLLGVYLNSTFPDGAPNDSGWGRWCGTSFATPVIAGALAALLSQKPAPADPIQELRALSTRVEPAIGEIVPVRQVP